ncbi:Alpha/Beta hydrolase protein [Aspergillus insuetus]
MLLFTLVSFLLLPFFSLFSSASPIALTPRATLTRITNFGTNPASLLMYIYIPSTLSSSPGIVVTLHGASGNAQQQYTSTPYARLADQYGFIVVYPESPQGAWDATSRKSMTHDGGGASQSIASMVRFVESSYSVDEGRVVVQGVSSGGAMANTMAGTYPDIFTAASIYSAGSSGNIRSMYPGYTGSYPKIQLYLGSEDTIIGSAAFNTTLAAWAAVHGYDSSPDQVQSDTPVDGWTTYVLGSKLEGIWAEGVGHPVSVQGEEDMAWWGFAR